jgi:hypothetical protein
MIVWMMKRHPIHQIHHLIKYIEPNRETIITKAFKSMLPRDCDAIGRDFMDMDLDDLDKLDAMIHTLLGDSFPIASKADEPIVFIKDSAYEFSIKSEAIVSSDTILMHFQSSWTISN